jgi:adenylate cyclase
VSLRLVAVAGSPSLYLLEGRLYTVGRTAACDVVVQDPTVSRRHAELEQVDAGVRVRDLGSTNGTFLNGDRIFDAVAAPGARLDFGKAAFEVRREAPEPRLESGDDALDATILRQVPVHGPADIAAQLSAAPQGPSLLRIGGASKEERQARKLALLIDIAKELSQQTEIDVLLDRLVGLTFQVLHVDRVAVLMPGAEDELVPRVWRSRVDTPEGSWRVPRPITRKAVNERVAVLIENAAGHAGFEGATGAQRVQSALCAPLLGKQGTVLGLLYLDNLGSAHSFAEEDLEFLTAFAGMAAVALENSQLIERVRREAVILSNFQRYFAPDLVQQIAGQTEEVQLGGAKRWVVVLFSDIRGFTSISERMNPDEIASLLTEYFTEMVEIVFEHGGTLDKFMGDAMMALWGAPLAGEDDADRAVRAAIAMQRALARLNREWRLQGRQELSTGIGINAGEVFAGNIGSNRRLEYTVIGDAVNTASRLCREAGAGEILVAEPLYLGLSEPPPVSALPPLPLRGKAQPVPVYRIEWTETRVDDSGSGSATSAVDVSSARLA